MLKNSLLLDTSFYKYNEMIQFVKRAGINIWMEPKAVDRKENPWSVDLMNYELTAILNDFTKAHMEYLKEIVTYVYGNRGQGKQTNFSADKEQELKNGRCTANSNRMETSKVLFETGKKIVSNVKQVVENTFESREIIEKKKQMIIDLSDMTILLRNARIDKEIKLSSNDIDNIAWDTELIRKIKNEALDQEYD